MLRSYKSTAQKSTIDERKNDLLIEEKVKADLVSPLQEDSNQLNEKKESDCVLVDRCNKNKGKKSVEIDTSQKHSDILLVGSDSVVQGTGVCTSSGQRNGEGNLDVAGDELPGNCNGITFASVLDGQCCTAKKRSCIKENSKGNFEGSETHILNAGSNRNELDDTVSQVCLDVYNNLQEANEKPTTGKSENIKSVPMHVSGSVQTTTGVKKGNVLKFDAPLPDIKYSEELEHSERENYTGNEGSNYSNKKLANLIYDFDSDDSDLMKKCLPRKKESSSKLRRKRVESKTLKLDQDNEEVEKALQNSENPTSTARSLKVCDKQDLRKVKPKENCDQYNLPDLLDCQTSKDQNMSCSNEKSPFRLRNSNCQRLKSEDSTYSRHMIKSPNYSGNISHCKERGDFHSDKEKVGGDTLHRRDSLPVAMFLYSSSQKCTHSETDEFMRNLKQEKQGRIGCKDSFCEKNENRSVTSHKENLLSDQNDVNHSICSKPGCEILRDIPEETKSNVQNWKSSSSNLEGNIRKKPAVVVSSESENSDWAEKLLAKKKKRFRFKKKGSSSVCSQSYHKSQELVDGHDELHRGKIRLQKTLASSNKVSKKINLSVKPEMCHHQTEDFMSVQKEKCTEPVEDRQNSEVNVRTGMKTQPTGVDRKKNADSSLKLLDRIKLEMFDQEETSGDGAMDVEDIFSDCFILDTLRKSELTPDEMLELQISKIK